MNRILHIFEYVKRCYNSRWNASCVPYVMATHTITRLESEQCKLYSQFDSLANLSSKVRLVTQRQQY